MDQDLIARCTTPEQKGHYSLNRYKSEVIRCIRWLKSLNLNFHPSKTWAMLHDEPVVRVTVLTTCVRNHGCLSKHPHSAVPGRNPQAEELLLQALLCLASHSLPILRSKEHLAWLVPLPVPYTELSLRFFCKW